MSAVSTRIAPVRTGWWGGRGWAPVTSDIRGRIALALLVGLVTFAVVVPELRDPIAQDAPARLLPPSLEYPFGTDELRRDLLARTATGLRSSLLVSLIAVMVGASVGTTVGMVAGYVGKALDAVLMRLIDAWLAFPGLLAAIAILAALGPGIRSVTIALSLFSIPMFARLSRAQVLVERPKEYVEAAIAIGARPQRVLVRHIAVNAAAPLVTQFSLALTVAIRIEAGLNFLGLGTRPPAPSLGGLISNASAYLRDAPLTLAFPALVLGLLLLALTLLSDSVNDWLERR